MKQRKTTTVSIDEGIPIPKVIKEPSRIRYPWTRLKVGDSFLMKKPYHHAMVTVSNARKRYAPRDFVYAEVEGGCRIWRVK